MRGETDDYSYIPTEPLRRHDMLATIRHLLGLDHERRTDSAQGRNFRLIDMQRRVVRD